MEKCEWIVEDQEQGRKWRVIISSNSNVPIGTSAGCLCQLRESNNCSENDFWRSATFIVLCVEILRVTSARVAAGRRSDMLFADHAMA